MADVGQAERTELTGTQTAGRGLDLFAALGEGAGLPPRPSSTLATYRKMRRNPTLALGRMVGTMPIRTATVTLEADAGVPEERTKWMQAQLDRLWPDLVRSMLYARDFGFVPFEKVFRIDAKTGWVTYHKLKYLIPEKTRVLLDKTTGGFAGLKQGDVTLPPEKCLVYTYDKEGDDYYGQPLLANAIDPWNAWTHTFRKMGLYTSIAAGAIPLIEYPVGSSRNAQGQETSNYEVAQAVARKLSQGYAVTMPNTLAEHAPANAGIDPRHFKAWQISFIESGQHGDELIALLRHNETLMLRGYLVPERAALEGQTGNRAEAETHGDLSEQIGGLELADILRYLNDYVLAPLSEFNWGIDAGGSIRAAIDSIDLASQQWFRDLVKGLATGQHTADDLLRVMDIDAVLERSGLPLQDTSNLPDPNPQLTEARRLMDAKGATV